MLFNFRIVAGELVLHISAKHKEAAVEKAQRTWLQRNGKLVPTNDMEIYEMKHAAQPQEEVKNGKVNY